MFWYGIYSTKATYVEEGHLLSADEFWRFIYDPPTTVGGNCFKKQLSSNIFRASITEKPEIERVTGQKKDAFPVHRV